MLRIVLPPATRTELAERAVQKAVSNWLETLESKQHLRLDTDIEIEGPYFSPFIEDDMYGRDLWLARGFFTSTKPRMVREDVVVGQRRLAEDVGMSYQEFRTTPQIAAPEDMREQLQFVAQNADKVYQHLRELRRLEDDSDARKEGA